MALTDTQKTALSNEFSKHLINVVCANASISSGKARELQKEFEAFLETL